MPVSQQTVYLRKLPPGPRPPRSTRAPTRSSAWWWPASSWGDLHLAAVPSSWRQRPRGS